MRYFLPVFGALIFGMLLVGCQWSRLMTQSKMENIVRSVGSQVEGGHGRLLFVYDQVPMVLLSDPEHDRMRIVAPVKKLSEISSRQNSEIMEANFHTALDARYASNDGILYAAYIHPLSPLTEGELESGLKQVANLVKNFGTTYAGGDLVFRGSQKPQ